jgi:hypothetical protein
LDRFACEKMPLAKPPNSWSAVLLGAANGLVYSAVLHLAERLSGYVGWPRVRWAWLTSTCLLIGFFAVASYLAHRILLRRLSSVVLLWFIIGLVAVCAWNALFLGGVYWERYAHNWTVLYHEVTAPNNPMFGLFSLALMAGTALLFACALKLAANPNSGNHAK